MIYILSIFSPAFSTWEGQFLLWLQEVIRHPALTPFMKGFSFLGDHGQLWILITLLLLLRKNTRPLGIQSALALLFSLLVVNLVLKNLVARPRPYECIPQLQLLLSQAKDFSFPSGHSSASFAAAWLYFRRTSSDFGKKAGRLCLLLAGLIAFSRLYVGIHYPSDVLAGILIGILCGEAASRVYQAYFSRFEQP